MTLLKSRLTIDDFMLEMLRMPADQLRLDHLQDWVAHLELPDALLKQHIEFCDQQYCRKLLCRTSRFDLLILGWQPGQASTIHDHANSLNVTRVCQGILTSRTFAPVPTAAQGSIARYTAHSAAYSAGQPGLQMQTETHLGKTELASVERYQIHQLANTSTENLVTLHLYAHPLQNLQVYCPRSGRAERVPVQYEFAA